LLITVWNFPSSLWQGTRRSGNGDRAMARATSSSVRGGLNRQATHLYETGRCPSTHKTRRRFGHGLALTRLVSVGRGGSNCYYAGRLHPVVSRLSKTAQTQAGLAGDVLLVGLGEIDHDRGHQMTRE